MKVTIKDIAKACSVSRGTVDRALNDRADISLETKNMIKAKAKEMGYQPHFLAKSLATGKTFTIGLIVFDLHNEFFANIVHSAQEQCHKAGYSLSTMVTNMDKELELECVNNLVSRNVDGLIISSVRKDDEYINMLKNLKIPVVTISNRLDPSITHIGINEYTAMHEATTYALDKGYKQFLYVSPPLRFASTHNIDTPNQRYNGFINAINNANQKEPLINTTIIKDENYVKTVANHIANTSLDDKVCIICSSDIFVLNIMTYLRKKGIRLPNNYGIMGFDNLSMLEHFYESLTTVSYPMKEVGELATQILIEKIIEKKSSSIEKKLTHKIIEGQTL